MAVEVDFAAAVQTVVKKLQALPYDVHAEEGFRLLAAELERRGKNLDPRPYIHSEMQNRWDPGAVNFYGRANMEFSPRSGYEQNEEAYRV